MTLIKESRLKVHDVPIGKLVANPWNPNRMDDKTLAKLTAYVKREGLVEPLVVRPRKGGTYEIIGGEHRWRAAKELGYKSVPCVSVQLDDRRAKVLSINLNELKGQSVPSLLAELVHDLSRDISLEDLSSQLPYDVADLSDLTDLLRLPDGLDLQLEEEAEAMKRDSMRVLSFPLNVKQLETVEQAIDTANETIGGTSRSASLTYVAREYLAGVEEEREREREEAGG